MSRRELGQDTTPRLTEEEGRALLERIAAGDRDARQELILRSRKLVTFVLRRFGTYGLEWEDARSLGYIGLIEAVDKYTPALGARFSTFAGSQIRGAIWKATQKQIRRESKVGGRPLALDAPVKHSAELTLAGCLPSPNAGPEARVLAVEARRAVHDAVDSLPPDLGEIIRLQYLGERYLSQQEVARLLGTNQMSVCRRDRQAYEICRAALAAAGY